MQLRAEGLSPHLAKGLARIYTVHGDEPLLAQEAADQIRAAARQQGFGERQIFTVSGAYFDWAPVLAAAVFIGGFGVYKSVSPLVVGLFVILRPEASLSDEALRDVDVADSETLVSGPVRPAPATWRIALLVAAGGALGAMLRFGLLGRRHLLRELDVHQAESLLEAAAERAVVRLGAEPAWRGGSGAAITAWVTSSAASVGSAGASGARAPAASAASSTVVPLVQRVAAQATTMKAAIRFVRSAPRKTSTRLAARSSSRSPLSAT